MKKIVTLVGLLLVAVMALSACGGGSSGGGGTVTNLTVTMHDDFRNGFQPKTLQAKTGTVKVTLENKGALDHDFAIPALKVAPKTVRPGKTETIEFQADKAGTYEIVCQQAGHKEGGMTGTLTVE